MRKFRDSIQVNTLPANIHQDSILLVNIRRDKGNQAEVSPFRGGTRKRTTIRIRM